MEILLRKASSLERAAVLAASKIELVPLVRVSVHTISGMPSLGQIESMLHQASDDLEARIKIITDLHEVASTIRTLADVVNTKQVRKLLSEKHRLDALEKVLTGILDSVPKAVARNRYVDDLSDLRIAHDPSALLSAIKNLQTRLTTLTSGTVPDIEALALSPDLINQLVTRVASIKRRRSDLMDELAAANLNEKIKLPDHVVTTLRLHGIVE